MYSNLSDVHVVIGKSFLRTRLSTKENYYLRSCLDHDVVFVMVI